MPPTGLYQRRAGARDFVFFQNPHLWPHRPFLPLLRWRQGSSEPECGLLYDTRGLPHLCGLACTVFLQILFALPPTEAQFLAGPRVVYDTFDEVADDGWVVD
jgi:hypothetical protein